LVAEPGKPRRLHRPLLRCLRQCYSIIERGIPLRDPITRFVTEASVALGGVQVAAREALVHAVSEVSA
ncbi:hypothetical protein AB0346_09775, partial [Nocardia beijingensis]|uniref:hypothetical protein n=1 Tax=Nocardia beijingensis TaxID=95162 RepID=UPI00344F0DAD